MPWSSFDAVIQACLFISDFLRGFCPAMHIHVRRIPISEVPTNEQEFQRWMYRLYEQKDR